MLKRLFCLLAALCLLPLSGLGEEKAPDPIVPLTEAEIPATPEGMHYYLLLCSDRDESSREDPGNTDGIMLAAIDTQANRVMLISVVRDLLVQRPDGQPGRINGIAKRFSLENTVDVINSHFGIRVEKYLLVNWKGVAAIIDTLGGVEVTLTNGEVTRLKDKLAYKSDWAQPELNGAGTYRLRGFAAVTYMRIRSDTPVGGETYDYRRTARARAVVSAILDGLRSASWQEALQLATQDIWDSIAATNLSLADMLAAAGYAYALRGAPIEQLRLPVDGTHEDLTYLGMATQQIDYPANRQALWDFLFNGFTIRQDDGDDGWD